MQGSEDGFRDVLGLRERLDAEMPSEARGEHVAGLIIVAVQSGNVLLHEDDVTENEFEVGFEFQLDCALSQRLYRRLSFEVVVQPEVALAMDAQLVCESAQVLAQMRAGDHEPAEQAASDEVRIATVK